jgi:hypothetical protein
MSRRKVLGFVVTSTTGLLAGCGVLGGDSSRANPNDPPDVTLQFNQNRGVWRGGLSQAVTIEIIHDGGDKVDPETLSVTVDGTPLEGRSNEVWKWSEAGGEWSFDSHEGVFKKGDAVAIRGIDDGTENHPQGGEVIRVVWTAPNGDETKALGKYTVKECLSGATPVSKGNRGSCPGVSTTTSSS